MAKFSKTNLLESLKQIDSMRQELKTIDKSMFDQFHLTQFQNKVSAFDVSSQLINDQLSLIVNCESQDNRSTEDMFRELYFKLEWCVLTFIELKSYKQENNQVISDYMNFKFLQMIGANLESPNTELLKGRQKGFFTESVIGYLVSNIAELYRIDKIQGSVDSVLYTKLIKLLSKDYQDYKKELNIINTAVNKFIKSVEDNESLIKRFSLARNKLYSHHTNYNPKTIETDYKRTSLGVSSTIKNETNISDLEITKLLNPFIEMFNEFISVSAVIGLNDLKVIEIFD